MIYFLYVLLFFAVWLVVAIPVARRNYGRKLAAYQPAVRKWEACVKKSRERAVRDRLPWAHVGVERNPDTGWRYTMGCRCSGIHYEPLKPAAADTYVDALMWPIWVLFSPFLLSVKAVQWCITAGHTVPEFYDAEKVKMLEGELL